MKKLRLISVKILPKFHIYGEQEEGHQSEKTVVEAPYERVIYVIAAEQDPRD